MAGPHTLPRSFAFAWNGLAEAAVRERNFRIHLAMGVLAAVFAARAPLATAERALILLCIALVLAAEATNSALEAVVDLASPRWSEGARVAKDAAAGAVLALSGGSVLVLVAVAYPRLDAIAAAAPVHALPATGAIAASAAALALPAPFARSWIADVLLAFAALAGLFLASRGAASAAAIGAAACCLAIAMGGAARRRRRAGSTMERREAPPARHAGG
ncbi:MAG TPA: diacylglycerol kinase family protein [Anaeromyxobacter sp.]